MGSFSGLPEALQCWWLHVDDVGLQFVSPDCLNGLTQIQIRGFDGGGVIPNDRFKMIFDLSVLWNHDQKGLPWQHLCLVLTFGSISMTQIFPLFRTSFTDSILVPYRFPLYSPYSRNLPNTIFFSTSYLKENQLKRVFSLLNEGETWSLHCAFLPMKRQTHRRQARRRPLTCSCKSCCQRSLYWWSDNLCPAPRNLLAVWWCLEVWKSLSKSQSHSDFQWIQS